MAARDEPNERQRGEKAGVSKKVALKVCDIMLPVFEIDHFGLASLRSKDSTTDCGGLNREEGQQYATLPHATAKI